MMVQLSSVLILLFIFNWTSAEEKCTPPKDTPCRANNNSCENYICRNGVCEIRVVVILPDNNNVIANLSSAMHMMENARDYIKTNILPPWIDIVFIEWDDKCDPSYAQIATIEAYADGECVNVILGPICDFCLATVSRILKFLRTPLLTAGGFSQDFEKPKIACEDEYFMMIRTGVIFYKGLAKFLRKLLIRYNWKKLMFLYDKDGQYEVAGQSTCSLVMQTIVGEVKDLDGFVYEDGDLGLSTLNVSDFLKQKISTKFAITIMCASNDRIRDILLAAETLDRMVYNGEYIFLNIDLTNKAKYPDTPWADENNDEDSRIRLEHAYNSVITLTMDTEEYDDHKLRSKSDITSGFYDALLLYAHAIKPFINHTSVEANNNVKLNNFDVISQIWGKKFSGLNGEVQINCNGDRVNEYSLLSLNKDTGHFEKVARYKEGEEDFEFIEGRRIHWPSGSNNPPLDVPTCGYDNSKCPETSLPTFAIPIIAVGVIAVILISVGTIMYRKIKLETEIASMTWKVYWDDIKNFQEVGTKYSGSFLSTAKKGSQLTLHSESSFTAERQVFSPLGMYKDKKVAIKRLPLLTKVDLKPHQLKELKEMKDLQHDNLVKFHGACIEPPQCCILTEYCTKGSLQDLLENDEFKMDSMISISLLQDIVRGMIYLHQSVVKSHGSLSSSNCVVDSRLVVKVTDFGLHFLKQADDLSEDSHSYWKKKLWTAPEILRLTTDSLRGGTQKGDVYSFGIIIHEVIYRKGTFYLGDDINMEPQEIIKEIIGLDWNTSGNPLRPIINNEKHDENILLLMQKCWEEDETERPTFAELKNKILKSNKELTKGNILDNLLSRMEQYADNLEILVEEKTACYLEEKKKCEEVLYQLLPKSVASQLIAGESVKAETYDQVTVYFSDIVGFTSLSADSTPLEIVDLLNDLYTLFDSIIEHFDVYKIETIGDAYMVVSGLPVRNDNVHAREIARMALALLSKVYKFTIKHRPDKKLMLRIGIHTGPCVAGVVGLKMPRYCLFGDTVNTASRMESNGEALKIHVSSTTKAILDTFKTFDLHCRGEVEMKGKGKMVTYWLNGEKTPDGIATLTMNGATNMSSALSTRSLGKSITFHHDTFET